LFGSVMPSAMQIRGNEAFSAMETRVLRIPRLRQNGCPAE
jgi:hypothetical protein